MAKRKPKYERAKPSNAKVRVTDSVDEPKHSIYSASGSKIWTTCPGSVELSKTCPELPTSKYAEEGTRAHAYCEKILKGESSNVPRKDDEMHEHAKAFAEYVRSFMKTKKAVLGVETKAVLEHIRPGMKGTCDAWVFDQGHLRVIDFKYGQGITVEAIDNTQLQYYALGIARDLIARGFKVEFVWLHIYQPRAKNNDEDAKPYSSVCYPASEIEKWNTFFEDAVIRTELESDVFVAGEHCRYCRGKIKCTEIKSARMLEAKSEFSDTSLILPAPQEMKQEQIGEVLKRAKLVETWIGAVEAYAFELLLKGETVTGWKLVDKRGTRKWKDPEAVDQIVMAYYGLDAFDLSLKSPAQMEKLTGKDFVKEYAQVVSSGVTLVPESDKRESSKNLRLSAENDFSGFEIP